MTKKTAAILILLTGLLLAGCVSGISDSEARVVATQAALGTPPPPQYQTAAAIYMFVSLTPTPSPETNTTVDMAATMIYDNIAAGMTQQAIQQQMAQQQAAMTATAMAIQATASQQAALATQQVRNQYATSTQQAYLIQSTATQQSWIALSTATERSWQMTVTAEATRSAFGIARQMTQQAADAIRLEGESEQIKLAVERQRIKNRADAILPWTLVVLALVIAGALAYAASRVTRFERNPDGTFNPVGVRTRNGIMFLRPDLMADPALSIRNDGSAILLPPLDAEVQAETTRRAQAVDALRALPPGREKQAIQIAGEAFGTPAASSPVVDILPPGKGLDPVLDELEGQVLDHE
jgi:PBP1b-binding outer membrane lipoprotein LpoB